MGTVSIDGVVLCDCFEAGRALPPPCPVVRREPYFHPAPGYEHLDSEVRAWEWTACEHPGGCLVDHQLTRQFLLGAMAEYGGSDEFPATHAAMPDGSGAETTPEESARCLAEFDRLAALMADRTMTVIVNVLDDSIVFLDPDSQLAGAPRCGDPPQILYFIFDGTGLVPGVTPTPSQRLTWTCLGDDAVVRVVDADGSILFAAREFLQEPDGDAWVFRDVSNDVSVRHWSPVGRPAAPEPVRLRAELRSIDIDRYLFGVPALRELFEASVRTGRRIYWV